MKSDLRKKRGASARGNFEESKSVAHATIAAEIEKRRAKSDALRAARLAKEKDVERDMR